MLIVLAILAVFGLVFLVLVAVAVLDDREPLPPVEDRAAPYREGMHAAVRMQRVAQDLEQQIYAAAAQHLDEPDGQSAER